MAFKRAYIGRTKKHGLGGTEFALPGYGIADFIWLAWESASEKSEGTALSIENLRDRLKDEVLTAFEMKLTDWRKAVTQAYRYTYFADRAIVVVPIETAENAKRHIALFKEMNIGLWAFEKKRERIIEVSTPTEASPKSSKARDRAIDLILGSINFCKFLKGPHSFPKRF
jgi:hypothetical protein